MARLNVATRNTKVTHEGAPAVPALSPINQLRRSVLSCLLWEDEFYEDGASIAKRIEESAAKVSPAALASLAVEARGTFNLRHAPLLLLDTLARTGSGDKLVADTICRVIQRADELAELLAIHWRNGKQPIPAQMRKGLARAFGKFSEYQLAKYDRDGQVKLRDVLRLVRPKPGDDAQSALYKAVKERALKTPDTWEVALSGGADKKETFERLIREGKLGYFALLRNLRNMAQAGVDEDLINEAIVARKGGAERILPFRYIAAARAAPQFEPALDIALQAAIKALPQLSGKTVVLVDVSGSMDERLSGKSDLTRMDAAAALAAILPCESLRVLTFSHHTVEVAPRRGMAGVEAVINSQDHGGTLLGQALETVSKIKHDRLVVITDEQSHDRVPDPSVRNAYMINVGSYQNGVAYGKHWVHIDGFSEGVIRYIQELESAS